MSNPYRTGQWTTRRGEPLTTSGSLVKDRSSGRIRKSDESLVNDAGDINAGSKAELISKITGMMLMAQRGDIQPYSAQVSREQTEERVRLLSEALGDSYGDKFKLMGEELSDVVYDHVRREGFIRKVLLETELLPGQTARVRVRNMANTVPAAVMGTEDFKPYLDSSKEEYKYPPEYYVKANILVEDKEIAQVPGDLLTEKLEDAQEAIQVQEDTVLKRLLDISVSASNQQLLFSSFTPAFFSSLRQFLQNKGVPAATALMASDLWDDIIGEPTFHNWFDPVSKHELILTGVLGSILNVTIITDAFVEHTLRVLSPGEVYFLGLPKTLGRLFIRQQLQSHPIDQHMLSRPVKGWFLNSVQAAVIANINAVARGRKI